LHEIYNKKRFGWLSRQFKGYCLQRHLSSHFLCLHYAGLLQSHQLGTFDALWNYQGAWFEAPNHERGGWSGVNYIELTDEKGHLHGFYLKRQEGHMRKTWLQPFAGEPTFVREFKILQYLKQYNKINIEKQVHTPELVFFERRNHQSILLTKALTGFFSVDVWLKNNQNPLIKKQRILMQALATSVENLHSAGVQHRSLYLKHLFVKELDVGFDVAMIDFEKSRETKLIGFFKWMDLIKLHQRSSIISVKNKLYFFKKYQNKKELSFFAKKLLAFLSKESLRK